MPDTSANFTSTTITNNPLSPSATSLTVATGTGANYPSVFPFMGLLGTFGGAHELVQCTARASDTVTIVRGQEGTVGQQWVAGTPFACVFTSAMLARLWTSIAAVGQNPLTYGAVGNNPAHDDTAGLNAALALGTTVIPPGVTFYISAPLNMTVAGSELIGLGRGTSQIKQMATFSGAELILCSADFTGVSDLTLAGASSTYSSNPAAVGIQITGARSVRIANVDANYINGWAVQSTATSGVANYWAQLENIHSFQCAQGAHVLGVTGSNFDMGHSIHNCNFDQCQSGDGLMIEDAHDVQIMGLYGTVTAGSGNSLHIKGACAAVYATALDLGPAPGPSTGAVVLIESGTNGAPKQIDLANGICEGGASGVQITAGTLIGLRGLDLYNNGTYGVNLSGACDGVVMQGNRFSGNGSAGSAGRYDLNSSTSGHVDVDDNVFATPNGSTAGTTNNAVNVTAGTVDVHDNTFSGTGYTNANIFNGFPSSIRNNVGYNPLGSITAPTVTASPCTPATKSGDFMVYIKGGTVSEIAIGGVATGVTLTTGATAAFRLAAQQTVTVTYSAAPTWVWIGD